MDASRFAAWTRRHLGIAAGGALATALGFAVSDEAPAKKHHKHRKKPRLVFNVFGCVDVGKPCRGKSALCCSGICAGSKPKRGKPDKRHCVAHDTGDCALSSDTCAAGVIIPCTTSTGSPGACVQTTGKAVYCEAHGGCYPCIKDTDCQPFCGPQAACIVCPQAACPTGSTVCNGPTTDGCNVPIV